jgi:L-threonylcarbamoyladenylate synthase
MTKILFERKVPEEKIIEEACKALLKGGIVVLPTDTVPGIGCRVDNLDGIKRIFKLKGRPDDLPVPIILSDPKDIRQYTKRLPSIFKKLTEIYWPGSLTIVARSNGKIDPFLGGGKDTLGFRVPNYPLLRDLVKMIGGPLALTSANPHNSKPSALHPHLLSWWNHRVDLLVLGRSTAPRPSSTVVDISVSPPVVLRHGRINKSEILALLGKSE